MYFHSLFRATLLLVAAFIFVSDLAKASGDEKETLSDLQSLLSARRNYKVPEGGLEELVSFLKSVKINRPRTDDEFFQMQRAIRTASERVMELEKDKNSTIYQSALQDYLFSGARLIGTMNLDAQKQEIQRLETYLAKAPLDRIDYAIAKAAAQELERSGNASLAGAAYLSFGNRFAHSADAQTRASAALLTGAGRRVTIVGKPLELAGKKVDGSDFDLASLKGKVVLVEFWATWCQKCRAEYPAFKKSYEKYHGRGFEVVGVSADEDRDELEKYLTEQHVPWTTLHEKEAEGNHPALNKYGIFAFPSTFLIGRDGNVIATRVNSETLEDLLEKALTP